jgi:hypothetical protein
LAVRSLDGSGPQQRGVSLRAVGRKTVGRPHAGVAFTLTNTGAAAAAAATTGAPTGPSAASREAVARFDCDVYRLSVSVAAKGWTAQLLNGLAAVEAGGSRTVPVYVSRESGASPTAEVTLRAVSESDPSKVAEATVKLTSR